MRRGGDERAGFVMDVDLTRRLVTLRLWGFWNMALAEACLADLLTSYEELQATGSPWHILVDSTRSPPQKPEVQAKISKSMGQAMAMGVRRAATVLDSSATQLQLRRLGKESGMPPHVFSFFNAEDKAMAWLLKP